LTHFRYSYESRLLYWLETLDRYLVSNAVSYGLFGGAAVAAYIGHLPRKLHDIDLLVMPERTDELGSFLKDAGFELSTSDKSRHANFSKFLLRNHVYELIVSVFPGRFTLLDVDKKDLPLIGAYDFSGAILSSKRRAITSLANDGGIARQVVEVSTIPLEVLIISKLWPTFEPNSISDLLLLFSCSDAKRLRWDYLRESFLENSDILRSCCLQTFEMFETSYQRTRWYELLGDKDWLESSVRRLKEVVDWNRCDQRPLWGATAQTTKRDSWNS